MSSPIETIAASRLITAPNGLKGFDCTEPLTQATAEAFYKANYRFAIRYIPRTIPDDTDLTQAEAATILNAGLGLMVVQHVESASSWTPSTLKGTQYGTVAVHQMQSIHLPSGSICWLDLEGVS